ncbi:MAG: biotin transporter BioY [Fimbriimonas sp.]|nr:biotin transporter BioY [Fimbriimonas sp.]
MSTLTLRRTPFVDAVLPGSGVVRDTLLIGGGTALTIVAAQVTIPWQPVPFTLQTLAVMFCGLAMGAKRGALSQMLYVAIGATGAPIFAQAGSGWHTMTGLTGGYILSFAVVATLLGFLAERGWTRTVWGTASAMAIGVALNLGLGAAWLSAFIGWKSAAVHGILPFLAPEALKAAIVIAALPAAWKFVRR